MRRVSAYALFSPEMEADSASKRVAEVLAKVQAWLATKGSVEGEGDTKRFVFQGGRTGSYSERVLEHDGQVVSDHVLTETSGPLSIRTQLSVLSNGQGVTVYVQLEAQGSAYDVGPTAVDVRCPRVVRDLIDSFPDWRVGETPLLARPVAFEGEDDAPQLEAVLWHPSRNLPVVVVSQHEGQFLSPGLPTALAHDLAGVALVCTVDNAVAWSLTKSRDKQWSCFSGAVRIYWPKLSERSNPAQHPYWTRYAIEQMASELDVAVDKFVGVLRRQLLGLSAFAMPEPAALAEVRAAAERTRVDALRRQLRDRSDWQSLAEDYALENTELRKKKTELESLVADLQGQLANLQVALGWQQPPSNAAATDIEQELPPETVSQAVERAKRAHGDVLFFGEDVQRGVESLAWDAGPPDKILRYLELLAQVTRLRNDGQSLGMTQLQWLLENRVEASIESDSVRRTNAERLKRTWSDGSQRRYFDFHLKPSDGTSPDRCVRIYCDYDEKQKRQIVAWVGRHP